MSDMLTTLTFNFAGPFKKEQLDGKEHWVVPVVLIVEGTHEGNNGHLTYNSDALGHFPQGWDNKPVLLGHANDKGGAGRSTVINEQGVGILLNTKFDGGKLKSEAWLDPEKMEAKAPELMQRLTAGTPVPVSTGLFHDIRITENSDSSETREVINIVPDHLAILLNEEPACSIEAGAGLLMNSRPTANALDSDDLKEQLRVLLHSKYNVGVNSDYYVWIDGLLTDVNQVIFEYRNVLYRLPYSVTNEVASISDSDIPEPVIRQRQYRTSSGELVGEQVTSNSKGASEMPKKTELVDSVLAKTQMTEDDRKWLEKLDDEQLQRMVPKEQPAAAEETSEETSETPAAEAPAVETPEEEAEPVLNSKGGSKDVQSLLDLADPELREVLQEGLNARQTARQSLIGQITNNAANQFSDEQLAAMDLGTLRNIAAMATPSTPAGGTNFSQAPDIAAAQPRTNFLGANGSAPTANSGTAVEVEPLVTPSWDD
jgi:hypothetical protein